MPAGQQTFVGLQNYVTLLTNELWSPRFWGRCATTSSSFPSTLLVQNPIGLLLAALLAEATCVRNFFRTVIFLPTVLSVRHHRFYLAVDSQSDLGRQRKACSAASGLDFLVRSLAGQAGDGPDYRLA